MAVFLCATDLEMCLVSRTIERNKNKISCLRKIQNHHAKYKKHEIQQLSNIFEHFNTIFVNMDIICIHMLPYGSIGINRAPLGINRNYICMYTCIFIYICIYIYIYITFS